MQPSSASSGPERGSALRRYGPLAAIVVVVAIIAAVVVAGAGGDDKKKGGKADTGAGTTAAGGGAAPAGAVSFSDAAKAKKLDVTFPATCDKATGRVAMPYFFASECYANNSADNGGATAKGVTGDTIKVVVYLAPDVDPILDFITAAISNDDTVADDQATYEGYTEMFQRYYQTYGRKVQLEFLHGSGTSDSEVAARADAVKAVDELGAFAVWGGPVLAPAWTEEIKARGVICLGCPAVKDPTPSVFPIVASGQQTRQHVGEYVIKKLKGRPARFAGDAALKARKRVFGQLYIETAGGPQPREAAALKKQLSDSGVSIAPQIAYTLDPATIQEQAVGAISKLKSAGVTTVLLTADPIAPKSFTEEATKQNYFPEWIYAGGALVDTNAFGRTYDQRQWAHAFGISQGAARIDPKVATTTNLYEWFKGTSPPANDDAPVLFPQPALFFAGVEAAGPKLTAETFRQGLFTTGVARPAVTQPGISYGNRGIWPTTDYYGIDDFTEIWWDPAARGQDEVRRNGPGMMRFVDGGKRYRPGRWTSDLKVFDKAGSVVFYTKLPPGEQPKTYPSPARGG